MTFDHEEKMAIMHMAYAVMLADGKVRKGEIAAVHELKFKIVLIAILQTLYNK